MSDTIYTALSILLKTDTIIPDVIPASYNFKPSVFFSVVWPAAGLEIVVPGDKVPRESTLKEPEIKLQPLPPAQIGGVEETSARSAEETGDITYTLVMTDPDAPSREDPKFGQWRHWVISGVQFPAAETKVVYALKTKAAETPYYPPAPPPGSGYHRYVFLLFQEPTGGVNIRSDAVECKGDANARSKWDALTFAEEYGLKLVGINYFMTQVGK